MKQVPITPAIAAKIGANSGDPNMDTSKLAVFEAVAANTRPLRREGGLFQKAVIDPSKLRAMKQVLTAGEHVPLQTMHDPGIPKGRVFDSSIHTDGDDTALHTMFYLPPSESDLIDKLNHDVIGEVSIGSMAKKIQCSACDFDYASDDATMDNIWDCTCANDHKIGKKGVHVVLHGLKKWNELSLVDKGATDGAKVLGRPRQRMSSPERLAARGFDESVLMLFASANTDPTPTPDPARIVFMFTPEQYVALSTENGILKHTATDFTAKLTAAQTAQTAAEGRVNELTAQLAAKDVEITTLKAGDLARITAERDELGAFVSERLAAAFALTGKAGTALPETISGRVAALREAQSQLALAIPMGGRTQQAATGDKTPALSAFRR